MRRLRRGVKTLTSSLRDVRISLMLPDTAEFTTAEKSWRGGTQHSQSQTERRNAGNVMKTLAKAHSTLATLPISIRLLTLIHHVSQKLDLRLRAEKSWWAA